MKLGLRVDVDTMRGTRYGVPNLLRLFDRHGIRATFFFSVGPDNMGRHLWRMLRPQFAWKMLRTRAQSLYGWDILFRGTFWPGRIIGNQLADVIRDTARAGHDVGLHAWDHHHWQMHLDAMNADQIREELRRGVDLLSEILGRMPTCSAVPGWKCNDLVLLIKEEFGFQYNSDCRGSTPFSPLVNEAPLTTPQIPIDLPTYDEVVGREDVTPATYNDYLLSQIQPNRLNALTVHTEVEGIVCRDLFDNFLSSANARGIECIPLGMLLPPRASFEPSRLIPRTIPGREGWVACQASH